MILKLKKFIYFCAFFKKSISESSFFSKNQLKIGLKSFAKHLSF